PTVINNFFDQMEEIIALYKIKPWNFYNMDEKPFIIGFGGRYIICHKRGLLRATQTTAGGHESVTVLEAGSASGVFLPPLILLSGAKGTIGRFRHIADNDTLLPGARVNFTPNGYITRENFSFYIEEHFHPLSLKMMRDPDEHRLIVLDGHDSHLTFRTMQFCYDHKIHVMCFPSHSTHLLQPMDVGVFSPLANFYKQQVLQWSRTSMRQKMRVCDFFPLLHQAREKACTEKNLCSAFAATGLVPLDRERVLRKLPI
ncbi:CENP-B protein, partial [Ascobolus immersus RN42]